MKNKITVFTIRFIITTIFLLFSVYILKSPLYFSLGVFYLVWGLLLLYRVQNVYDLAITVCLSYILIISFDYYFLHYLKDVHLLINKTGIFFCLILCAILIIVEFVISKQDKEKKLDKLFNSRIQDLNKIKSDIQNEQNRIIGIDSEWGNGKSLIINHLIMDSELSKNYDFIKIDILSMNLDQLIDYLLAQIEKYLKNQGIYTLTSKYLNGYISNSYFGRVLVKILNIDDSYSTIIDNLSKDINKLSRSIIVIYEDIDRIDDLVLLKKIFYISEKLSDSKYTKIKFIYQYNSLELKKRGLDYLFLQKYIPQAIRLTHLSFEDIWDSIIENNDNKYYSLKQFKYKIISIAENPLYMLNKQEMFSRVIEIAEFKRENYTIRNIESFMDTLLSNLHLINENKLMIKVLFIKIFCPDFYNNLSTFKDLNSNFCVEQNKEKILLSLLINIKEFGDIERCVINDKQIEFWQNMSYRTNRLNFQTLIAYSILKIFQFKYIFDVDESTELDQYNPNESFVQYKRFERELYYLIEIGQNRYDEYHKLGIKLSEVIESIDLAKDFELILNNASFSGLISSNNEDGKLKSLGFEKWRVCFIAFRDLDCSLEKYQVYQSKLIKFFFESINEDDTLESIISILNIFLSNSKLRFMQKQFIEVLRYFSDLKSDKCDRTEEYQSFLQYIYNALILFKYIDNISIQKDRFNRIDINMANEINVYLDTLTNQLVTSSKSNSLDVSRYRDSINIIKKAINFIAGINICSIYSGEIDMGINTAFKSDKFINLSQNEVDNMTYSIKDIINILDKNINQ
jgi:hypothetical protein